MVEEQYVERELGEEQEEAQMERARMPAGPAERGPTVAEYAAALDAVLREDDGVGGEDGGDNIPPDGEPLATSGVAVSLS